MLRATRFRLYPTTEQELHFRRSFGCCRFAYNFALNLVNETYKETGKGLGRFAIQKAITELKKEYEWMSEPYSQCLQVVALNLSKAFINFFERRAGYPSFKSKHRRQSISYPQNVKVVDNGIKFPKIGKVDAVIHRDIEGVVKTVSVSMNAKGQFFASVLVDDGNEIPNQSMDGKSVGVDLGVTHFVITSDGSKFNNPRWLSKHERNLKQKQKRLSRRKKGSNNRNKTRQQVATVHNKITRCREDFHHKLSRKLVDENQVIVVENLAVRNMMKNHCLAQSIGQVGWGQFCTMLKYKSEWEGKVYVEVDRFFPSSKTCNVCLNRVDSLPLDIRFWQCDKCGTKHDRDINAALNIRDEGLRILTSGTGDSAYCLAVRQGSKGRKSSTTLQATG
ncbi:transposase [Synechocystis salina LEGE 06099]|uniref:RNA-guided endonuclease InsQ/TnpB family protein n=2 Tax=Synechocystis salina TaxID=945780 RepID=UPI00187FB033|nr:RNA-guided endonuclease TnpB family protein [Synechocystis salina]MBE9202455.1 transposase [Synechocystis salina LEGE 06099]